ncbi:NAD(P)/FAD-dependent oxidoreductase [Epidermidibacterium keratini]
MLDATDREAMHRKYAVEREKRLRSDGIRQWRALDGIVASADTDPFTAVMPRETVHDHVEFLFIGGGFAGLTICARLKEAGFDDFRILEAGGDFGGVWYWNRFPGAMCDTAAMVYLPLLEETGHMPSAKYVHGPEILAHAQRIGRHYDLYPHALFSTHLESLTWDESASRWIVRTREGDKFTATTVAMGTGPLNRPHLPGIPGIETYQGEAFHTARWDFNVTGGDWDGGVMTRLADKRVGIIGTGATAVQCIPQLGRDSGELFVFQRTPSAVDVRGNHPIDPQWYAALEPGWQAKWLRNFVQLQATGLAEEDLVHDGWTDGAKRIVARMLASDKPPAELTHADFMAAYHDSDDEQMTRIRARVDEIVEDPQTAQQLKAWYRQYCKRPCFHDDYLPTYNRPNVHLVDTDGRGVERIDETGVWVDGVHYELDVIVYASGFEFNSEYTFKSGLEVYGRDGRTLTETWAEGMQTFQGMHIHGFPNLFIIGHAQGSALLSNITSNYTDQGFTIAAILGHLRASGARTVEASAAAQAAWVESVLTVPKGIVGGPDCTPGYYNNEGQHEGRRERLNSGRFPGGSLAFFDYVADWRTNGRFEGLEFDGAAVPPSG